MEIANIEAGLEKVRGFIGLLEQSQHMYSVTRAQTPEWKQTDTQIQEQLRLVMRIAERADPELAVMLKDHSYGWPYHQTIKAARQLAGVLATAEEAERILGPVGPKLAATSRHPWIWTRQSTYGMTATRGKPSRPRR